MVTFVLTTLVSALIFAGIWRLINGPARSRGPAHLMLNITIDSSELMEEVARAVRERDEIARLERLYRK